MRWSVGLVGGDSAKIVVFAVADGHDKVELWCCCCVFRDARTVPTERCHVRNHGASHGVFHEGDFFVLVAALCAADANAFNAVWRCRTSSECTRPWKWTRVAAGAKFQRSRLNVLHVTLSNSTMWINGLGRVSNPSWSPHLLPFHISHTCFSDWRARHLFRIAPGAAVDSSVCSPPLECARSSAAAFFAMVSAFLSDLLFAYLRRWML